MVNRFLYIFFLNLSFITAQISGRTIAILDFEGIGINSIEAISLTDILKRTINRFGSAPNIYKRMILRSI